MSGANNSGAQVMATDALSAQLYASLEAMPDGFLLLDRDLRFKYVNAPAERILRRSREDLIGKLMWEEYPDFRGSIADREYARVMKEGGATSTFQLDLPPSRIEVRAFASPSGLAIFVRDISEEYATQERMRLLRAAVGRLDDIIVITGAATATEPVAKIVFVNEAFVRLTGYSAEEVIGQTPQMMRGPNTDVALLEGMRARLSRGETASGELIYYTKSGEELWIDMQMSPFKEPSGDTTHVVFVCREITERKRAEQALKESNERFRIVAQTTADVVWDWNLIDDTIWWGDGLRTRFGYETAPSSSSWWTDRVHPDDRRRVRDGIDAAIAGGVEQWGAEYRFLRADDRYAQVIDRGVVIRDEHGKGVRMVGSMLDATAQRELEAQLRQAQRLEAVGQLTGGVAHDFNNLLTVILSNAELLERRLSHDEQLHMLAEMTRIAAERGAELTSRLLAFSRRQTLDPKPSDIAALLRGMDGLLRRAVGERITISSSCVEGLWPALIDPLQLETAILNLCINARDAMPNGGALTIEGRNVVLPPDRDSPAGDYVFISVTDTGEGMDDETRAHAFEPFFTTKEVGKGSGLGLSMVYGFVTQSRGRIDIETAKGRGTSVNSTFHALSNAPARLRNGLSAAPRHGAARQRRRTSSEPPLFLDSPPNPPYRPAFRDGSGD